MKRFKKIFPLCFMGVVAVAVLIIGNFYFRFISVRIYEDSTGHLEEIYSQVNRSFASFVERNWGLLDGWGDYFSMAEDLKSGTVTDFITEEQDYWGFSQFYFLSENKVCMALDGTKKTIATGEPWELLMQRREPIMTGKTLDNGQDVTIFAVPVKHNAYNGFAFDAISISYTNADLASSLNVNAFAGKAKCFVIHNDGDVLLSTLTGGNVFDNYLTYLKAASDLDKKALEKLQKDWKNKASGLLQCKIGDVSHCILYQPVGYQDYILLSVVPQSAVSAGFLSVQKTTMHVLSVIFLLIGITVTVMFALRSYRQSRKSKMELQYRELMFDVLSNSVDDIFLMLDTENQHVDYVSPNIKRLLGIPVRSARENIRVMEKCAVNYNVVIPQEELQAIPLNGSISRECEYRHQTTGERRWYKMTVYRMYIQGSEKYIIVLSDRTLEQQMNQQLQEALTAAKSANEAKSNFLSNMSHDIRTPMNAIVGFAVLLEKDAEEADKVREYTRKITASSHHLLSLINDVLDMSKIESGKTSLNVDVFSLPELLDELHIILMPQAKAKEQDFEIQIEGAPPEEISGDKLRLNQILINLLSNAIKYTPNGGKITFTVNELPKAAPQFTKLRFVVKDNGIGMSEEFQKQIFMPFSREVSSVTNKIQGTGLGMAITKNLVDLMGGIIYVESRPGQGSSFTVELSFALPEQEDAKRPLPNAQPDDGAEPPSENAMDGRLFLVAEDNELNAEILTEMLHMEGADCELAENGRQALELFQKSEPGHYDMVLMDVQMPVMNGYEATRQIRACSHPEASTIPIVAMTANTFAEDVRDALDAGMDGHLAKPVDMSAVKALVGQLMSHKETAQSVYAAEKGEEE